MAGNKSRKPAKFARWRVWVQLGFLLVWLNPLVMMHTLCGPVFHCYACPWSWFGCPIGILAQFSALHTIPFAALGTLASLGAVFGAFICGWACPFGFLQDLIAKVPTPKFVLPLWMGSLRYGVLLAFVLVVPFVWGKESPLFICSLCPAGAIEGAVPNMATQAMAGEPVVWPNAAKLTILVLFVIAMFFTWRPWCTLFCPLGAIYGLLNHVSFLFLRFHPDRCIDCADCRSLCVAGGQAEQRIDGLHCVRCADCTRCRAVTVETVLSRRESGKRAAVPPSASAGD